MSKGKREFFSTLSVGSGKYEYADLKKIAKEYPQIETFPYSIRVLLENIFRNYDNFEVTDEHIKNILSWKAETPQEEIPYKPSRVLMQDFTGVPAVVDIAAIRSEVARKGKNVEGVNPEIPVDLVIDHSVQINKFGSLLAYKQNIELEYQRNAERYRLLKWAQGSFDNFGVVPPGKGICHQVNLEFLAQGVHFKNGQAFPDTLVGTDSHTPMVNGIGVIAWGVGGIEAEAALLGQPVYMLMPQVIGLKLTGKLPAGATTTDLVLTITKLLRSYGVVGKFVEVFGDGLDNLTVPDRATISNMSPEFGCTVTYFPIDAQTLEYMRRTTRSEEHVQAVEKYAKENLLWRDNNANIQYTDVLTLDLSSIEPAIAGPKNPHQYIKLKEAKETTTKIIAKNSPERKSVEIKLGDTEFKLTDGAVTIAAITSCTNTSNPSVLIGAGLLAKKAVEMGLDVKPWVKTSFAPGSRVVSEYLEKADLIPFFEALRFHIVAYGCTTCIGNSGGMIEEVKNAVIENNLTVASALSGNRNFEARIDPHIKMNFLCSPPLVIAYALAGRIDIDFEKEPLGYDPNGNPVFLKDIWPSDEDIAKVRNKVLSPEDFQKSYSKVYDGDEEWKTLEAPTGKIYEWDEKSTYIKEPPFFINISEDVPPFEKIEKARILLKLGDFVTTDHISPAGAIAPDSPAGKYLLEHGVQPKDFNSYGSRRGNHEVMMRGTFANVRLKNLLVDKLGGWTVYWKTGETMTVFDAAMKYQKDGTPLVVIGGKGYGSGSSRDWAAKGTALLGIKAVIAESFERIHRSNLVGMGVLPIEFKQGENADTLGLQGDEEITILGITEDWKPRKEITIIAKKPSGGEIKFTGIARLDSDVEIAYYQNKGILHYVLRQMLKR